MKERAIWFDVVRAISTISVIVLHVAAPILHEYGKVPEAIWNIGNFYDGTVRFCVPVFFMLSGALLLSKDYELGYFLKNRFWRIIPPLIFWSLIYIVYDHVLVGEEELTYTGFFEIMGKGLLSGSQVHLWFVYTLLGLYLFIPILRKWIRASNNHEVLYFIILWVGTIIYSLPYFSTYLPDIPLTNFAGYIGYLVLGYYLSNMTIGQKYIPILLIVVGVGTTIYGTHYLAHVNNEFHGFFYGYLTPNVLLSAMGVFLVLKDLEIKSSRIRQVFLFLSDHSFGIYLVHILILNLLGLIGINWQFANPIISIPVTSAACLVTSSLTIYLLRKVKYASYISG